MSKTCPKCVEAKELSFYYVIKKTRYSYLCKKCSQERCRAWQKANPEIVKAATKNWMDKNAARKKAYDRAWRSRNLEKVKAYGRRRCEKLRAKKRTENPEYYAALDKRRDELSIIRKIVSNPEALKKRLEEIISGLI